MSHGSVVDVAVVGAGLAGSGVAALLADRGWDVLLLEKDRFPRHKVCGEFLSPESQSSLAALGLRDRVRALTPQPIHRARLTSRTGRELALDLPGAAWGVSRYALDAALAAGAADAGARLQTGTTVTAAVTAALVAEDGYRIHLRGKEGTEIVRARSLILACGRHSAGDLPPRDPHLDRRRLHVGVKCHYTGIDAGEWVELFFFPGGYCGINQVEGGRANVCLLSTYASFAAAGRTVAGMIRQAAEWNPALGARLSGARPVAESACAVAPVDVHRRPRPWSDGAACLGDTASMIPPLCGDGMAMALRSAELCAPLAHRYLRGALSLDGWARAYAEIWQDEFAGRLRAGRWLQRLFDQPVLPEIAMGLGRFLPPLPRYLVHATRGHG